MLSSFNRRAVETQDRGDLDFLAVLRTNRQCAESAEQSAQSSAKAASRPSTPEPRTFVLVGAGDIAWCGNLLGVETTAKLIDQIPGTVFAAGDLAYERGTYEESEQCYDPTWGRFKKRAKPSPGGKQAGEIRQRATTASTWAPGTSLRSTPIVT
jgi:hypothetical protein